MRHPHHFILSALTAFGLAIRLAVINHKDIWFDEAFSLWHAGQSLWHNLSMMDTMPPLFQTLLHLWVELVGVQIGPARLLPLIFGVISIPLMYLLARKLLGEEGGLIAAALLAASPLHVYYSVELRSYSLFIMFVLLTVWLALRFSERPGLDRALPLALSQILLLYTHLFAILVVGFLNLWLLWRLKKIRFDWLFSNILAAALYLPWFIKSISQGSKVAWIPQVDLWQILVFVVSIAGHSLLVVIYGIFSLAALADKRRKLIITLIACIIIPTSIAIIASFIIAPIFVPRYLIFISIPLLLLVTIGIMGTAPKGSLIAATGVVVAVCLLTFPPDAILTQPWHDATDGLKSINKGEPVVIDVRDALFPFAYYYSPDCFHSSELFGCAEKNEIYTKTFPYTQRLESGYLVLSHVPGRSPMLDLLVNHTIEPALSYRGIDIYHFQRKPTS